MNANQNIIKKYNLLKYFGSSRMEQVNKQFKFSKKLLPPIPEQHRSYVLIISNQFRMVVPYSYSNMIKIPNGILKSKQSVIGFRNNFVFDNYDHSNFNLHFIYDNLCSRLYNLWLTKKFNVVLKLSTSKLHPWSFANYGGASVDVAAQIELNNLGHLIDVKDLDISNRGAVISKEIKLLQDLLERYNIMKEYDNVVPEPPASDSMIAESRIMYDTPSDYSDDEYLNLNGLDSIVTFNGIFVVSPHVISLDLKKKEFLINNILCYVECEDSEWRGHYLVTYWHDIHISTYEHRDNVPGGIQELWWCIQKPSATKTEMLQYLNNRGSRELKKYKALIKKKGKRFKINNVNGIIKKLDFREFESPELLAIGIRNPWLKNTIKPSKNDVLTMEFKWQDRSFRKYSKLIDERNKKRYGDLKSVKAKSSKKNKRSLFDLLPNNDEESEESNSNQYVPERAPPPMQVGLPVTDEYCYYCCHWYPKDKYNKHKCKKFSIFF